MGDFGSPNQSEKFVIEFSTKEQPAFNRHFDLLIADVAHSDFDVQLSTPVNNDTSKIIFLTQKNCQSMQSTLEKSSTGRFFRNTCTR